jgi:hypothetical protein
VKRVTWHFSREVSLSYPAGHVPAGWTHIYITAEPVWEHLDRSDCPDGLAVPLREWTPVALPLRCGEGREIRARLSPEPFYIDPLPM